MLGTGLVSAVAGEWKDCRRQDSFSGSHKVPRSGVFDRSRWQPSQGIDFMLNVSSEYLPVPLMGFSCGARSQSLTLRGAKLVTALVVYSIAFHKSIGFTLATFRGTRSVLVELSNVLLSCMGLVT